MKSGGISIIVPAYNEEHNIGHALEQVLKTVKSVKSEIIVVDDGSIDGTAKVAKEYQKKYSQIKYLRNDTNQGFGKTFKHGLTEAKMEYVTGYPADADTDIHLLEQLIDLRKKADLVIGVMDRRKNRTLARGLLSGLYIGIMNTLFGIHLSYYNGYFICKTKLLQSTRLASEGFTIFAEAKVRLLRMGKSYIEIPCIHVGRAHGSSKALSPKSLVQAVKNLFVLIYEVRILPLLAPRV